MLSDNASKNTAGVNDIHLASVIKNYGAVKAVRNIDLAIERGKFFSLLGPSGCGKTTTLRLIAGFESPTSGTVWIDGKDVTAQPAYRRDFAMVFQNLALFPHLSVSENVAFGLKMRHVLKSERAQRVHEALDLVKLTGFGDRRIRQLSGGQQQRVALARAIVVKPAVLLLDEPLSALDKNLREDMQIELRQLQRSLGITTVFVTHDQEEALTLSDEIAVMNNGIVEQRGSPKELYSRPRTKFIASFLGSSNFLTGKVIGREGANAVVEVADLRIPVTGDAEVGSTVELAIRPENIRMTSAGTEGGLAATIREVVYRGATTFFLLDGPAGPFNVHAQNADASSSAWKVGDTVKCEWAPESAVVLKSE